MEKLMRAREYHWETLNLYGRWAAPANACIAARVLGRELFLAPTSMKLAVSGPCKSCRVRVLRCIQAPY